jgi:hypothetical protein
MDSIPRCPAEPPLGLHHAAAPVHVGEWFEQDHRLSLDLPPGDQTMELEMVEAQRVLPGQPLQHLETNVVAVLAVFGAGVTQADDQPAALHHSLIVLPQNPSPHVVSLECLLLHQARGAGRITSP